MKQDKKIINKSLFETTYFVNSPDEIKKLKASGVITPKDTIQLASKNTKMATSTSVVNSPSSTPPLTEVNSDDNLVYVEYLSHMKDENEFDINGEKYEYVWARYPDGKRDIGVYVVNKDLVYSFDWFRDNILKHIKPFDPTEKKIDEGGTTVDGIDVPKLKHDVSILVNKIGKILEPYVEKINTPIEQAEFIATIGEKIGVPRTKLGGIINNLKDISKIEKPETSLGESNKITKGNLIKEVNKFLKPTILKIIKVKDI